MNERRNYMKKPVCMILTLAALAAVSVSTLVSADDITIHTSVGRGEITYTEGAEVSITGAELASKVARALMNMKKVDGFVDAGLDASLKMGKETMPVSAELICNHGKSGDETYTSINYSLNLFGEESDNVIEDYTWKDGEQIYRARRSEDDGGNEAWSVETTYDIFDSIDVAVDENNAEISKHIAPEGHLYEHDGKSYYACIIDSDTLLDAVDVFDKDGGYNKTAGSILDGNKFNIIFLADAESGMPHAFSIELPSFESKLPGDLFGSKEDIAFSLNDAHITAIFTDRDGQVEIPEEVLSAPVKSDDSDEFPFAGILDSVADTLGLNGK